MILCRCGASKAKPFCDSSHNAIGFGDEKSDDRQTDQLDEYKGKSIKILDFGYRPAWWSAYIKDELKMNVNLINVDMKNFIVSQAISWPLIAACSIRVRHDDASFKSEYIIPQMVLEWISGQKDVDGIRYFSVNVDDYPFTPKTYLNYV